MTTDEYNLGKEIGGLRTDVLTIKNDIGEMKGQIKKLNTWRTKTIGGIIVIVVLINFVVVPVVRALINRWI